MSNSENWRDEQGAAYFPLSSPVRELGGHDIRHNNQNTVFMIYELKTRFCLLHDNRIFHFKKEISDGDPELGSVSTAQINNSFSSTLTINEAVDCLNNLLTTPKYRGIFSLYGLFKVIDYAVLLYFVYVLVSTAFEDGIEDKTIPLYLLISLEVFYDVMESTTKLWPMERLKFFTSVAFYLLYLSQFIYLFLPLMDYWLYWMLLGVRFLAYVLDLGIDITLDTEIHNDIMGHPVMKEWFPIVRTNELDKLKKHYVGSSSSLLFDPVIEEPRNTMQQYRYQWLLLLVGVVIVYFFVAPLFLFVLVAGGLVYIILKMCQCCFGEICSQPSEYLKELKQI